MSRGYSTPPNLSPPRLPAPDYTREGYEYPPFPHPAFPQPQIAPGYQIPAYPGYRAQSPQGFPQIEYQNPGAHLVRQDPPPLTRTTKFTRPSQQSRPPPPLRGGRVPGTPPPRLLPPTPHQPLPPVPLTSRLPRPPRPGTPGLGIGRNQAASPGVPDRGCRRAVNR